jgi:hypothetical protein
MLDRGRVVYLVNNLDLLVLGTYKPSRLLKIVSART